MGIVSEFVDGLRVTDKATAEVVQMVLAGKVGKSLVNLIEATGGKAMGICGIDGRMVEAKKRSEALGYVGQITHVNTQPITDLLEKGYIPVVSSVGCDEEGNVYNINADTMAAQISGAMGAECLISMTDRAGHNARPRGSGQPRPCRGYQRRHGPLPPGRDKGRHDTQG